MQAQPASKDRARDMFRRMSGHVDADLRPNARIKAEDVHRCLIIKKFQANGHHTGIKMPPSSRDSNHVCPFDLSNRVIIEMGFGMTILGRISAILENLESATR
jgi:hypothetical protein